MKPRFKSKYVIVQLLLVACTLIFFFLNSTITTPVPEIRKRDADPRLLVIGVPSVETNLEERNRLRQLTKQYSQVECPFCTNAHRDPQVEILFFVGKNPLTRSFTRLPDLEKEIYEYEDLVMLDIVENMNEGKTWEMLRWIYENKNAHFVMKSDEDSFVNVPMLLSRLNHFRRMFPQNYGTHDITSPSSQLTLTAGKLYYGFPWIYDDVPLTSSSAIMIGMGYTLGRDLLQYIATDAQVRNNLIGYEDAVTHQWLSNRTDVLRVGDRLRFHDPPDHDGPVSWSYRCDDVVIHRLKTNERWATVSDFYLNCCAPLNDKKRGLCRGSPKSSTCCKPGLCDRACAPSTVRPVQVQEPFMYISDEDLGYLSLQPKTSVVNN